MNRNRNSFAAFQQQRQTGREELISKYLGSLAGKGVSFPHVTALAEFVSAHVAIEEHGACHKATLLRNPRYRSLLLSFLTKKKAGLENFDLSKVSDNNVHAVVTNASLEVSNLRRENERLKSYIASLERYDRAAPNRAEAEVFSEVSRTAMESVQIKYATVCQAMQCILNYMQSMVAVDADTEQLIDLSKMRNNVIVERRLAAPFFEWLRINRGIL